MVTLDAGNPKLEGSVEGGLETGSGARATEGGRRRSDTPMGSRGKVSGKVGGGDGREIEEAGGNLMSEEMVSGVRVEDKKLPHLLR